MAGIEGVLLRRRLVSFTICMASGRGRRLRTRRVVYGGAEEGEEEEEENLFKADAVNEEDGGGGGGRFIQS